MIDSFNGQYRFLSNFYHAPFKFNGYEWPTVEHAYVAHKSDDPEVIMSMHTFSDRTPGYVKKIGRFIQLRKDWNKIKFQLMTNLVTEKFEQNPHLMEKLIETGDEELVEGNHWGDRYWGVSGGEGKNNLGKILMNVRKHNGLLKIQ